eukprot:UN24661
MERFLTLTFQKTSEEISSLHDEETWMADRDTHGITILPDLFKKRVEKTLQICYSFDLPDSINFSVLRSIGSVGSSQTSNLMVKKSPVTFRKEITTRPMFDKATREVALSLSSSHSMDGNDKKIGMESIPDERSDKWLVTLVGSFFKTSFEKFLDCMHVLAFDSEYDLHDEFGDRRLLAVLSNAMYVKTTVHDYLWKKTKNIVPIYGFRAIESERQEIVGLYEKLENLVFEQYVRRKTLKLNRIIKRGILYDGTNWEIASKPNSVRDHTLRFLLECVFVHNEIYSGAIGELQNTKST